MPKARPNDSAQLTLFEIKEAVKEQLQASLAEPRRVLDPLRPMAKYPDRMSVAQVATAWGVSQQHVLNLIDAGELAAIDLKHPQARKHKWRVRREDVIAFENQLQNKDLSSCNQ